VKEDFVVKKKICPHSSSKHGHFKLEKVLNRLVQLISFREKKVFPRNFIEVATVQPR